MQESIAYISVVQLKVDVAACVKHNHEKNCFCRRLECTRGDMIMLIICYYYGFLLSNISTYYLKVARRPVEQWNGIQCTGGDVIMLITCYYYYGCLLWMFANASRYIL